MNPPINNIVNLILLLVGIFICIFTNVEKKPIKLKIFLVLITMIFIFNQIFNLKKIEEIHSTFFSQSDISKISNLLPQKISLEIQNDYNNKFDLARALKSYDREEFASKELFNNYEFIENSYAFSSDNFFSKNDITRNVNFINFKSREQLRIGQINTINYNLVFDKELRRSLPFYVIYKFPKEYQGSKICGNGSIYYSFTKSSGIVKLNELNFLLKKNDNCIKLEKNFETFYLIGYSINKDDNLEIKLHKNFSNHLIDFLSFLTKVIFIIIFYLFFYHFKHINRYEVAIFLCAILSTILFTYLKDSNLLFALRYFRGGADGLFHEFQGYSIVKNLYNLNILEALKGGEDVFYFMPGLRYFIAINKIFFGETSYGYLLIGLLLPFFLYKFLQNLLSQKIAVCLLVSFMFFPIFENMGFAHFNYIGQIVRNHAETLSIFLIIFAFYQISIFEFYYKNGKIKIFFLCFILSFATFCRPNFFPTTLIIFLYIFYNLLRYNKSLIMYSVLGYATISLSLIHNLFYGNQFTLFTYSSVHFVFLEQFQLINSINFSDSFMYKQFLKWNPLYNIHRLIILIYIIYNMLKYRNPNIIILIFLCMLCQHLVLFMTHPDSRYAYLAWLLTFILFSYFVERNILRKLKYFRNFF